MCMTPRRPTRRRYFAFRKSSWRKPRDWEHEAVQRQPDSPKQHVLFAQILQRTGEVAAAREQLAVARQLASRTDAP